MPSDSLNAVSVVVPAYNCQSTIFQTIQALLAQTYAPVEIVVIDDGSTDETARIVQSFPEIRYLRQENAGPSAARNRGFELSKGDLVFFTDSDCIPERDWVEKMRQGFFRSDIGVVAGSYGIANREVLLARCIHAEILFRHHKLMPRFPKAFGSYNFCIKREVFKAVGGFNTQYRQASGEDNDLSYKVHKAGFKIYFCKEAQVRHFHTGHLKKYLSEQFRHGFWRAKMYFDHPDMAGGDDYTFWKDIIEVPVEMRERGSGQSSIRFFKSFYYMIKVTFAILLNMVQHKKAVE